MKRDTRKIVAITDTQWLGPRLEAQLHAGKVVDVAGFRLRLARPSAQPELALR